MFITLIYLAFDGITNIMTTLKSQINYDSRQVYCNDVFICSYRLHIKTVYNVINRVFSPRLEYTYLKRNARMQSATPDVLIKYSASSAPEEKAVASAGSCKGRFSRVLEVVVSWASRRTAIRPFLHDEQTPSSNYVLP